MRAVALGGGHGLEAAIRALRHLDVGEEVEITAIVSVADDGGSSGRLVRELGIPPPGDARRCLLALAEDGGDRGLAALFAYRFKSGELAGHALGNLVLAALVDETGSIADALVEAGRLLGSRGRVLPAAVDPVRLAADVDGVRVEGQSQLTDLAGIHRVVIDPPDPAVHPDAPPAIEAADLIVIGPGSLFTSVLAVMEIPRLRAAVAAARCPRLYVCNLTEEHGETLGLDIAGLVSAFVDHVGAGVVDAVLVNTRHVDMGVQLPAPAADVLSGLPVLRRALAADHGAVHDPVRLGSAFTDVIRSRAASR